MNIITENFIESIKNDLSQIGYNKYDLEIVDDALRLSNDSYKKQYEIMNSDNTDTWLEPTDEHYLEYGKYLWEQETERYMNNVDKFFKKVR